MLVSKFSMLHAVSNAGIEQLWRITRKILNDAFDFMYLICQKQYHLARHVLQPTLSVRAQTFLDTKSFNPDNIAPDLQARPSPASLAFISFGLAHGCDR